VISEGLSVSEDWSNGTENAAYLAGINYSLKIIYIIENSSFTLYNITVSLYF